MYCETSHGHGDKCLATQENMQMHSIVCADYTTEGQTSVILHQRGRHEALNGSKLPGGRDKTLCTG